MTYSKEVARMTWRGEQPAAFKAGLALFPANYATNPVSALSTLSSVYHSYASHRKRNDLHGNILRRIAVRIHIASLGFRGMLASDRMVRKAGGLENLTVNQLDVRQSVMRAVNRRGAALEAVNLALKKFDPGKGRAHAKALLHLGRAHLLGGKKGWLPGEVYAAEALLPAIEKQREYRQLARICRHLEEFYLSVDRARLALDRESYLVAIRKKREWATRMAEENGQ